MSLEFADIEQIPKDYRNFEEMFENFINKNALVTHRRWDHSIELIKEKQIPDDYVRTLSERERKIIKEYIDENLKKDYIRSSKASAGQSITFASKSDNEIRFCIDFRRLNDITKKKSSVLSLMADLQRQIIRAKWFTQLNLRDAFHLIRIKEGDEWKTVFKTEYELFEYTVMSFGLENASATFQAIISEVLQKYLKEFVIAYLNDIKIYLNTFEEHKIHVKKVLKVLQKAELRLKLKKCKFHIQRIKFLKWILSSGKIEINSNKLNFILTYSAPQIEKQLLRFLGMTVFFKNAISEYSQKTVSLTDFLQKDTKFVWTNIQQNVFQKMKNMFRASEALKDFDLNEETFVKINVSDKAIDGCLCQGLKRKVVSYFFRKLSPAEQNYIIEDKEMLVIVSALQNWRIYVEGTDRQMIVLSNYKNL